MSELSYKSYTGRWSASKYLTVDAMSMETAVEVMRAKEGRDPLTIVQWKDDICVADEKSDKIHIKMIVKWIGSDKVTEPYGNVYPSEIYIPPNDIAIITAIPLDDRIGFMGFQDENGEYLTGKDESEYAFRAKTNTVIYAVFSDSYSPTTYSFDPNTFMISSDNVVSLNTTSEIIDDPYKIPTSHAVFEGLKKKVERITLNGRSVEIENQQANIDLTQDYLYEDEDIDFADLF